MLADFHLGYCAIGLIFFGRSLLACRAFDQVPLLTEGIADPAEPALDVVRIGPADPAHPEDLAPWRVIASPELRFVTVDAEAQDGTRLDATVRARAVMSEVESAEVLVLTTAVIPTDALAVQRAIRHLRRERAATLWLLPRPRATWTSPLWLSTMTDALPVYAAINRDDADFGAPDAPGLHRSEALRVALDRDGDASSLQQRVLSSMRAGDERVRVAFAADAFTDTAPHSLRRLSRHYRDLMRSLRVPNWILAVTTLGYLAVLVAAIRGPFATTAWGWFATAGWLSGIVPAWLLARVFRIPTIAAALAPFAAALDVLLQMRSLFGRRAEVATADS